MAKEGFKLPRSLKQLGEIQVSEWDFMALLNKDIKDLEIAQSLKKLGNIEVMEWDFKNVLPAVNRLAQQEVDIIDLVKRTAAYKVMDWDFKSHSHAETADAGQETSASPTEVQALIVRLKDFLQYVTVNLIDDPAHAQIKVQEIAPCVLRFKLVLLKKDVILLIGREGNTAAAIRNNLKATAKPHGVQVLLQIHSHEEEMALMHGMGK